MNVCYRTSCYGTSIQRILRGSIFEKDNLDLVFVKNYSFQYLRIQTNHSTGKTDNDLITPIFEQQAFGTILDARLLSCDFQDQSLPTLETSNSSNQDQQPYTQETRFGHTTIQGNDIILALTDYGQLVFCTLVGQPPDLSSTGRFECVANITLDKPGLEFDKVNKKLAVDPWSRAIAIASYQDRLDIMILNDTMSRTHFSPAAGMGSIYEEGIIWHMEFLHSETSSWDHILLAAIVYNDTDKICRIIVYSIDGSDPELATIKLVGRLPLDRKTPLPVLLIPLPCYPESFIIVTESTVSVLSADDISCGNVLYPVLPICDAIDHTDPYQDILITSYSFCVDPTLPILCLGTAEGYLLQLDISDLDLMKWKIVKKVHAIGQQMCMLGLIRIEGENVEPTAEVLLYSGESADGQILAIIAGNDNQEQSICYIMQNLMNRAPLIDWQAIRKTGQPDKIIACSGQDEQGSLHTISYDCDSSILYTSENNWNGTTKMWCFSHTLNCVYLVASSSFNTRWIALDNENNMNDDVSMTIQTDTCTIFAGSLKMETLGFIIIQILRNQILLSNLDGERLLYHEPKSEYQILFATAWNSRNHSYISVCMSTGEDHMVQVYACQLSKSTSTLELCLCCQTVLSSAPSCFYRFAMEDQEGNTFDILVVGMYDSKVILQLFDSTTSQLITLEIIDCHDIPHSFATIYYSEQLMSLLIGTRTGKLLTVDLSPKLQRLPSWQILITNRDQIQALGSCPVLLCVSQENGLVFASSDSIWLIGYDDKDARLVIEAVYNHDLKNIEALLPLISIGDIQDQYNGNKLALVADGRLYVLQVKKKVQLVTRKLVLSSTPRKHLLHDHSTSYLVTSSNYKGKVYHHLKLIDHCNGEVLCEHRFDKGETVLALSKWQVQNKNKLYHYVCVGLETRVFDASVTIGSLHLYRLKAQQSKQGTTQYSIRLVWKEDYLHGGIQTICPHPSGLLFASGQTLYLCHLDMDKGDLVENTRATLRFPITSIHVSGDCICVTGHTESVSFYSYDSQAEKIKFLKSDSISRNVHHSLLLDNHMVIGLSLSGGMFALQESTDTSKDSLQTLFAFHYPDIIIKPRLLSLHSNQSSEYTRGILASHLLPWTSMDELGKSQPIVGCTISGGMIMAYRCSSSLFTLLDTLQQALLRFGPTQPLLGSSSQFQQWYTQLSGPQTSTLHADYLFLYSRLTKAQQYQVIKQSDINLVTLTQELFSMDKTMETEQQQMEWTAITLATLIDKMDYYYY